MSRTKLPEAFNFKDVVIRYDLPGLIHVFYLSDDQVHNKEVNDIIVDMWYKMDRLVNSYPLVELHEGFEYKRMWIYISKEHLDMLNAERDRRANIRKAPII